MKLIFFFILLLAQISHIKADTSTDLYTNFKEKLHNEYGFDYRIRAGFMAQRGSPNGSKTVFRDKYEIEANWDAFSSDTFGNGSIQFLYEDINYSGMEAASMANKLNILTPINDEAFRREFFKRLTYTHQLPGKLENISLSVGQFLIGNFGKTSYKSRPTNYFNNFSLQKNVSKAYPVSGFGGYITYKPYTNLTLITGLQDTTNYFPQNISVKNLDENKWTNFFYASWSPNLTQLGKTSITGWIYHSPSIKKYDGKFNREFKEDADGYIMILHQNIGKYAIEFKANASIGNRVSIERSYAAELMYNDPFNRNNFDQIGLGFSANKVSNLSKLAVRSWENVLEGYWTWGISDYLTITPDVQLYINPALTKDRNTVIVNSIQAKLYF